MQGVECYLCHRRGHTKNNCPQNRGLRAVKCYKCGGIGHVEAKCTSIVYPGTVHYGKMERRPRFQRSVVIPGGGRFTSIVPKACNICGRTNHLAKDCRMRDRQFTEQANRHDSNVLECLMYRQERLYSLNCHKEGHIASQCTEEKVCRRCGQPGHVMRECTQAVRCNRCLQTGHFSRDCPNATVCFICKLDGHKADACPNKDLDQDL